MSDGFAPRSMKRKNVKGLALTPAAPKPPPTAETGLKFDPRENDQSAQLEIGIEYKLDLKQEDLEVLKELGSGNGGTVSKVRHVLTGTVMARKVGSPPACIRPASRGVLANTGIGHSRRSEEGDAEAHCQRTPDHARLLIGIHRQLLRCFPERQQRCHHVHGVRRCWVGHTMLSFLSM